MLFVIYRIVRFADLFLVGRLLRQFFQLLPPRIGGCFRLVGVHCLHFVNQRVLEFGVFIAGLVCTVFFEHRAHLPVAFAHRMHVLDGYGQCDGVVNHVCDVEVVVAFGYYEQLVGVVAVVLTVFDGYVICGVDGENEVVETSVANERDGALYGEVERVDVGFISYGKVHGKVGIVNVGAFHVLKEAFVEPVLKLMSACGHAFEW